MLDYLDVFITAFGTLSEACPRPALSQMLDRARAPERVEERPARLTPNHFCLSAGLLPPAGADGAGALVSPRLYQRM